MRHSLAEARSLAYHRAVATRLRAEPGVLAHVRERLLARIAEGTGSKYSHAWLALIDAGLVPLAEVMEADDEPARALRQASPFANLLTPKARWALWAAVRRDFERAQP